MTKQRPGESLGPGDLPGSGEAPEGEQVAADRHAADASLLALVDRLAALLERSDLAEIEVEAGGTALVLRNPAANPPAAAPPADPAGTGHGADPASAAPRADTATAAGARGSTSRNAIVAPLTGVFYASPNPGSPPFVAAGREIAVGQVIGLIEAMKLFNEIKADRAGLVVRLLAENGALVRARQPLVEVEPL
jgi:acetyl-CoA carboxylase biotin carboxyl carrier protein